MKKYIIALCMFCFCLQYSFSQELPVFKVAGSLSAKYQQDSLKMAKALEIFEKVMNDRDFQKRLLDTTCLFDLPNDPMRFLTTRQIVDTLFDGKEWYHSQVDNTANINWQCNRRKHKLPFSSTIGYGLETDSIIHTYIFYVRNNDVTGLVNNLAHEWCHKIGFDHQKKDHTGREITVPYLFGNLVEIYASKYIH